MWPSGLAPRTAVSFLALFPLPCLSAKSSTLYTTHYDGAVSALRLTPKASCTSNSSYSLTIVSNTTACGGAPSWLTVDNDTRFLYCSDESVLPGSLSAFAIQANGSLTQTAKVETIGGGVANAVYSAGNKSFVAIAHYSNASISTFALPLTNGSQPAQMLGPYNLSQPRPVADRQTASHPQQIVVDPSEKFIVSPDLGADLIRIFTIDQLTGTLNTCPSASVKPGAGPRHAAFRYMAPATQMSNKGAKNPRWKAWRPKPPTPTLSLELAKLTLSSEPLKPSPTPQRRCSEGSEWNPSSQMCMAQNNQPITPEHHKREASPNHCGEGSEYDPLSGMCHAMNNQPITPDEYYHRKREASPNHCGDGSEYDPMSGMCRAMNNQPITPDHHKRDAPAIEWMKNPHWRPGGLPETTHAPPKSSSQPPKSTPAPPKSSATLSKSTSASPQSTPAPHIDCGPYSEYDPDIQGCLPYEDFRLENPELSPRVLSARFSRRAVASVRNGAAQAQPPLLYVVAELSGEVLTYSVSYAADGCPSLALVAEQPVRPPQPGSPANVSVTNATAPTSLAAPSELRVQDDFLYVANRNDSAFGLHVDSVTAWSIGSNGTLTDPKSNSVYGWLPRTFEINRAGDLVAIGNQDSGTVAVVRRDVATGMFGELVANVTVGPAGSPTVYGGISSVVWGLEDDDGKK